MNNILQGQYLNAKSNRTINYVFSKFL